MELDFSFFGFSPKPKTVKINTVSTNKDYSKLSLKKKCNLKIGTSSRPPHDPARTLKESTPTNDNTLKNMTRSPISDSFDSNSLEANQEKENTNPSLPPMPTYYNTLKNMTRSPISDSFDNNSSLEANQEKENTKPSLPTERRASSCRTSLNNECLQKVTSCNSLKQQICSNEAINSHGNSASPLPPNYVAHRHNSVNRDVGVPVTMPTIIISDSSSCSNNSEGESVYTSPIRSRASTKNLQLLKESTLPNIKGKNKCQNNVSSHTSLFEEAPNNVSIEYTSSSLECLKRCQNVLLPSECRRTSDTSISSSYYIRSTTRPTSTFSTNINKNASSGAIPTIVLETSDSESEHGYVPLLGRVMKNSSKFLEPSKNLDVNDEVQGHCQTDIASFTQLQTAHMTTSKFQYVQKWLDRSSPSESENENISLVSNSKDSSPGSLSVTNVSNSTEETKSKHVLSLSAENVLNQLYGPMWKESSIKVKKKSQTEKKLTHKPTFKDIDDSFDEFLKKFNHKQNKLTSDNLPDGKISTDFINDDSISNESLGFYQAVVNSETGGKSRVPPGKSKRRGSYKEVSNNRKLDFSDEYDYTGNTPLINSNTHKDQQQSPKEDHSKIVPRKDWGEQGRVIKKSEINTRKPVLQKLHSNVGSLKVRSFLESLSASTPESCCHPEAHYFRSNFKKKKEELCTKLFTMFNSKVFGNVLPHDLKIEWNLRLLRTAGLCFNGQTLAASGEKVRTSRISLSTKVCDSPDRLRDTLIHELCHAATWTMDAVHSGHGRNWKVWSIKAMKCYPELPRIARCHNYNIQTKYTYKCSNCGYCIGRHSKSLNMDTKRCGHCFGKFMLFVNYKNKAGAKLVEGPQTPRNPNGFALFVKENYGSLKTTRKDLKHGDVMKLLGQQFSAAKIS